MRQSHAFSLLWLGLFLAIAPSSSAKPGQHVAVSYDAKLEAQEVTTPKPKKVTTTKGPLEDEVESTIARAQSEDFDRLREDAKRHVHYTAASSPTGAGASPVRHTWYFQGSGPPVVDVVEDEIAAKQQREAKLGLEAIPMTVQRVAVSSTVKIDEEYFPKGCFEPRHSSQIPTGEKCPEACPLFAEDTGSPSHCNFKCVNVSHCGLHNRHTNLAQPVPDVALGFCRRCSVPGCHRCNRDSHADQCAECLRGFSLQDGACVFHLPLVGTLLQGSLYLLIALALLYFVVWYVSLARRKKVNMEAEAMGLQFRTQTKLCMPESSTERGTERKLWPLKTNTLVVPVAGPGSVLFFRYQVFIMAWAFVVLVLWVVVMSATNGSLYALGTEDPNSPRELCSVIHAGYESQRSLMWAKVAFLALAYVASFSMCIAFGIFQRRTFNRLNVYATHADFVAMVEGLPPIKGSEKLEDMLKEEISKATSQDVVGVSVGWDFDKYADRIQEVLEADVLEAEKISGKGADSKIEESQEVQTFTRLRPKWLRSFDNLMLTNLLGIDIIPPLPEEKKAEEEAAAAAAAAGTAPASGASGAAAAASSAASGPTAAAAAPASEGPRPMMVGSPEEIAKDLVSSPIALVVFRTESGRDAAVAEKKPIAFHGSTLQIKQVVSEPMGVNWENFSNTKKMRRERLSAAIKMIILAGFAWSVCIYLPYAWYASSFSYSNGDKPSGLMTVSLTVIVVLGNLVMYTTCAEAAKRIGYLLKDSEDGVYMVLYTFSILFNILLDAAVAGYISYRTAVAQRARTYGGILISDLTRAQAVFESFEIQRQLGMQVYKYCWPSMFLLPFIGEAVGANWFTLHLARLVVTTFPHIKGYKAQQALKIFVPMDAGRYADVLINIAAAVLIFFLPGGHTLSLFVTLILSHSFILCFDHFRVLRCVPSFCFCSSVTDEYAQMLSIIPCSLILVALAFKFNCDFSESFCFKDSSLGVVMLLAFFLHASAHWWALKFIVPKFGDVKEHEPTKLHYEEVASSVAPSFFNLNPAFCLRSKYFYKHETPCTLLIQGREHVLKKSEASLCHFDDPRPVEKEEYGRWRPG